MSGPTSFRSIDFWRGVRRRHGQRLRAACIVAGAALAILPATGHAWWDSAWKQRDQVTFDTTASGVPIKQTQNGMAVALRLHLGNFDFTQAKPDGSDLRFVAADDKTPLPHWVERFDAASGLALVWVNLPLLQAGSDQQRIWLYHGNPNAAAVASGRAVFGDSTTAFHFSQESGPTVDDGGNGATLSREPAALEPAGLLGASGRLAGNALVVAAGAALDRAAGAAQTASLWLRTDDAAAPITIFEQGPVQLIADRHGADRTLVLRVGGKEIARGGSLNAANWHHLALIGDASTSRVVLDGADVLNGPALPAMAGPISIGAGMTGRVDAIQFSPSVRSADWLLLSAASQGPDSAFARVAPEDDEASAGGDHNYMGILVGNLTVDAWVVIAILAVMFVIAVLVMVFKSLYLSRTDGANRQFLQQFRSTQDDFLDILNDSKFARSSLYRLYQTGVAQVRKRLPPVGTAAARDASLSGASIDAVKASIDADLVHESHRLNSQMVMLTIAISGGPFLGLLGTVVGVMITFAAIAAAGDVNVNAIAPGIAAALLATVAGLAVAIPALFGYNYLAGRIKNVSADMQIFVDEFVTRTAERYGRST